MTVANEPPARSQSAAGCASPAVGGRPSSAIHATVGRTDGASFARPSLDSENDGHHRPRVQPAPSRLVQYASPDASGGRPSTLV